MPVKAITRKTVFDFVDEIFSDHLHAKRVASLADASLGAMRSATLSIHAIGLALAGARDLVPKHAIKQVDRLLSNRGIEIPRIQHWWAGFVLGERKEAVIALDWTDFDKDDQTTICAYLISSHGRATPLAWRTVRKSELKDQRNDHEDALLTRLRVAIPQGVRVTILADRGFADQKLFRLLTEELNFHYIIRFRQCVVVADGDGGAACPAEELVPATGRVRLLRGAKVTRDRYPVHAVVLTKAKGMKEAWCLVTSDDTLSARQVVKRYARRFTIEEGFRDTKDLRFGMGLAGTHIKDVDRRDRMLILNAVVVVLLTLLGAAGEDVGLGKGMKANTSPKRAYSLYRQGLWYYEAIPAMREARLLPLMRRFDELLRHQRLAAEVFGVV